MRFMRNKETIGNDIVDELRKMTDAKACDITKDDFISVFAKAKPGSIKEQSIVKTTASEMNFLIFLIVKPSI